MQIPRQNDFKFWFIATIVVLATSASLAELWPLARNAATNESGALVQEGNQTSGGEAESDFQLAAWLDPSNLSAYSGLGSTQIELGQPVAALASLSRAGQGTNVAALKVRTLIELGRYSDASNTATRLVSNTAPENDIVLAALAYGLAGRTNDAKALASRVTSPEATQAILRAQTGKLPLASELYASGLLQSSGALLTSLPASYERNMLLGSIYYTRHSHDDLKQAQSLIATAVSLSPSSIDARQLLAKIYIDQHNQDQADQQNSLIVKLQTGRS